MPPEVVVAKIHDLAGVLAERLEREAAAAIAARGAVAMAVPGGSVATSFFPRIAACRIDWSRTEIFQTDERAVPPRHPDSNFALLSRLWLEPAAVPAASARRMRGEARDLEAAALACAVELPARLDVALLGVGPDGHVASLFPGHPALLEGERPVLPIYDSPKPPPRRLTLSLPVLRDSRLVVVAAMGAAKADAMREALRDPASQLPVALVIRHAEKVLVLMDQEAAT